MANKAPERPKTRKEQREQTHARFIEAILQLLEEGGPGALSISELGRRLGVHHSLFYAHFKDLDAALTAAASQVIKTLGPVDRDLRRQMLKRAVTDRRDLTEYFKGAFERWLEHRSVVRLLLSHRAERSAMGEALRSALGQIHDEIRGELEGVALQVGIHDPNPEELLSLSDLHLNHFLWALDGILEERSSSQERSAAMLADLFLATNQAFFRRLALPSHDEILARRFTDEERRELDILNATYRELVSGPIENVIQVLGNGDVERAIEQIFRTMRRYFIPRMAREQVTVLYRITYEGKEYPFALIANRDGVTIRKAQDTDVPRLALTIPLPVFLATSSGLRHFDEAHRHGEVMLEGDLFFAVEFYEWFYMPPRSDASSA